VKLYRSIHGVIIENDRGLILTKTDDWDDLISNPDLHARVSEYSSGDSMLNLDTDSLLAPIVSQDVWAAGVTYYKSRNARMEESKDAGGGTFYDRVYNAQRPELFFKATGHRVVGPGGKVRIRSDSKWSVPEPELTLVVNPKGKIVGYTIGNDMSSRDIEGDNPLYLPQAKVYDGSCAIGPCILLSNGALPKTTKISIEVERSGAKEFSGTTTMAELKRDPEELVEYLFRENSFPKGVLLMTGTGIIPNDDFTLERGDIIRITIDGIGTLENIVA
jgi:2-dehydro-3-deoxy-D-arabinonate dehydratase